MTDLKLIAFDAEDLSVLSAHLQDAVARIGDLVYLPRERRFAMLANRFDWPSATATATTGARKPKGGYARRRTGLRFERVLGAKLQGIDLKAKRGVLSLLAITFDAKAPDDPAGTVTLIFAGNAAIRLEVECIEAELKDVGGAWTTRAKPTHDGGPKSE